MVAAEINTDSPDFGHLEPMVTAAERELAGAGVADAPEVVVADAGYWHHEQMDELAGRGIPVLIPPDADKRKGARPGWAGGRYAFMRRVLETDTGATLYAKRQVMIEPVFANTKFNAASIASYAAAEPPAGPNGGSSPPPTISSSSTRTRPPPRCLTARPPSASQLARGSISPRAACRPQRLYATATIYCDRERRFANRARMSCDARRVCR